MNDQGSYRKVLASALMFLIFIIDLTAVYSLFPSLLHVLIFGTILAMQTLLVVVYHQRSIECEGCMEKTGRDIYMFYKIFAAIGIFSILIILLNGVFSPDNANLKIVIALTYAVLLITGISTAFNAIVGVRDASCAEKEESKNKITEENKEPKNKNIEYSVFEFLLNRMEKRNLYIYFTCAFVFIFSIILIEGFEIIAILMLLISFLAFMKKNLFRYRLNKGWYANNFYEAKEAIRLIDENFDSYDKNNNSGNLKIFPSPQPECSKSAVGVGEKL